MLFHKEDTALAKKIYNSIMKYFRLPKISIEFNHDGWISFSEGIHKITRKSKMMFRLDLITAYQYFILREVYYQHRVDHKINNFEDFLILIVLHETKHYIDYLTEGKEYLKKYEWEMAFKPHNEISFEIEADRFSNSHFKQVKHFIKEQKHG